MRNNWSGIRAGRIKTKKAQSPIPESRASEGIRMCEVVNLQQNLSCLPSS